ncbi:MAG: hypothetical protein P4K93_07440 [Terracidiphilus sp.]|nr:hypothetical protein [Terracidiphilus sp.]
MTMRVMGPVGIPEIRTRMAETAGILRGLAVAQGVADGGGKLITVLNTRVVGVAGDVPVGGTAVGDAFPVVQGGETVAIAGAVIAAGQYVKADATSRFIPAVGASGTGEEIAGRAQSSAAVVGDEFIIDVLPMVK